MDLDLYNIKVMEIGGVGESLQTQWTKLLASVETINLGSIDIINDMFWNVPVKKNMIAALKSQR